MTNAKWLWVGLALVLLQSVTVHSQTAWLPPQGRFTVHLSYVFETFEDFWMGTTKASLPDNKDQHTFSVGLDYGLFDNVALDLTLGYTRTSFAPLGDTDGLDDTTLGIRWRVVDEFEVDSPYVPTLTVRLGGIIAGTYETGEQVQLNAAGDGASGVEITLLFGKAFGNTGFGLSGGVGYRYRMENVPADFFASIGVYKTFFDSLAISLGYRRLQGLSGLDVGDPDFTPARFAETKEIYDNLEAGLSYSDRAGRQYGLLAARTLHGRNTGEKTILGAFFILPF